VIAFHLEWIFVLIMKFSNNLARKESQCLDQRDSKRLIPPWKSGLPWLFKTLRSGDAFLCKHPEGYWLIFPIWNLISSMGAGVDHIFTRISRSIQDSYCALSIWKNWLGPWPSMWWWVYWLSSRSFRVIKSKLRKVWDWVYRELEVTVEVME